MGYVAFDHRSSKFIERSAAVVPKLPYVNRSHLFENFTHVRLFVISESSASQCIPNLGGRHFHRIPRHSRFSKTPHLRRIEVGTRVQVGVVEVLERNHRSATTIRVWVVISYIEFVAHIDIVSGKLRTCPESFLFFCKTLQASKTWRPVA